MQPVYYNCSDISEQTNSNEYVIFACDDGCDPIVWDYLKQNNIPYRECFGGYTMDNGDFVEETSYLIPRQHFPLIVGLGVVDAQESFLHLYNKQKDNVFSASLFYNRTFSGAPQYLGRFPQVSESDALKNKAGYTRVTSPNGYPQYFIAKK